MRDTIMLDVVFQFLDIEAHITREEVYLSATFQYRDIRHAGDKIERCRCSPNHIGMLLLFQTFVSVIIETVKGVQDTFGFTRRTAGIDEQGIRVEVYLLLVIVQLFTRSRLIEELFVNDERSLTVLTDKLHASFREGVAHRHNRVARHPDTHLSGKILHTGRQENRNKTIVRQLSVDECAGNSARQYS